MVGDHDGSRAGAFVEVDEPQRDQLRTIEVAALAHESVHAVLISSLP
jgi:hypothetical protein